MLHWYHFKSIELFPSVLPESQYQACIPTALIFNMPVTHQKLGDSGLYISNVIVGCMSYGHKEWADWVISDEEKVFSILKKCYDSGLRTFDTANVYSNGHSEVLLGKFIKKYDIPRDKIVILSKLFMPLDASDPSFRLPLGKGVPSELLNLRGLLRKHILDAVAASVERLGTYIDVLQIHRLDREVPKHEIMKALNDTVEQGYTRYLGASSMRAVEFAELQFTAEKHGWFKFVSMQNYYNLLYREEEREMIPFCLNLTLGSVTCIPWSPIARGLLSRPLGSQSDVGSTRSETDGTILFVGLKNLTDADSEIIKRVEEVAKKHNVSMANVATAWVLSKGHAPIVGINSVERVEDTLKAFELTLSEDEVKYLEEPYVPRAVAGY